MFVTLMLGYRVSMAINKQVCLLACDPFPLIAGVERATIDASVQHVVLLLEEVLQLLHEELALEFVFLVVQVVQLRETEFAG